MRRWCRLRLPADITLPRLHRVFQATLGWTNSHLHEQEEHRNYMAWRSGSFDPGRFDREAVNQALASVKI
jgi:hypothetical protein